MKPPRLYTKPSEAMRAAHARIKDGRDRFVCIALGNLADQGHINKATERECRQFVRKLLGGHYTLDVWIAAKLNISVFGLDHKKLRDTRLAWIDWIDWMAHQYELQGR